MKRYKIGSRVYSYLPEAKRESKALGIPIEVVDSKDLPKLKIPKSFLAIFNQGTKGK